MLPDEGDRLLDALDWIRADLRAVDDPALVHSGEPARLDPGVGEMTSAISTEQQHSPHCRHRAARMIGDEMQRLKVCTTQLADRRERLGSSSEVQCFRVESGHRLFVVSLSLREPSRLPRPQLRIVDAFEARQAETAPRLALGLAPKIRRCPRTTIADLLPPAIAAVVALAPPRSESAASSQLVAIFNQDRHQAVVGKQWYLDELSRRRTDGASGALVRLARQLGS